MDDAEGVGRRREDASSSTSGGRSGRRGRGRRAGMYTARGAITRESHRYTVTTGRHNYHRFDRRVEEPDGRSSLGVLPPPARRPSSAAGSSSARRTPHDSRRSVRSAADPARGRDRTLVILPWIAAAWIRRAWRAHIVERPHFPMFADTAAAVWLLLRRRGKATTAASRRAASVLFTWRRRRGDGGHVVYASVGRSAQPSRRSTRDSARVARSERPFAVFRASPFLAGEGSRRVPSRFTGAGSPAPRSDPRQLPGAPKLALAIFHRTQIGKNDSAMRLVGVVVVIAFAAVWTTELLMRRRVRRTAT